MCGLAGFLDPTRGGGAADLRATAETMAATLHHRGPDDSGSWVDEAAGIAFGHRRLSIIDLSPAGHQPMVSRDGRYVIAYNGEVYNFKELRRELESGGAVFRGDSDTEVVLEACAAWGLRQTVGRLNGMFAFALWDRDTRTLALVRDRIGIKPLYWGRFGELIVFGSELKALRAHPGWSVEINRDALAAFLRHNYLPGPHSIYRDIHKLQPGHLLICAPGKPVETSCYWDLRQLVRSGAAEPLALTDADATEELEALLKDAVGRRMVADVPLGAFLSGGVDSSTVVALMQAQSQRPVKTFTIGFSAKGYNEAQHAKKVAQHLGTDHTELYVTARDALDVIPSLPQMFDEPFADSSQIPAYLVAELTRRHVTVSLSGDGGDELFAGYVRYLWGERLWRWFGGMPRPLRASLVSVLKSQPADRWDRLFGVVPAGLKPRLLGHKLHRLADILRATTPDGIYRDLVTHWKDPEAVVLGATEPKGLLWDESVAADIPDFRRRMQYYDAATYLVDDILTKVDRTSMAVSLEARVPLLDHRVIEFALQLPPALQQRGGTTKWLLRQVLYKYVPRKLIERPKMGFAVPIDSWLRGPLREWAEALLSERRLREEGYFDPAPVRRKWQEFVSGKGHWHYQLWDILMFQAWHEHHSAGT